MVLDVNTQVGDKFSESKTDVHLFEFHSKTAGFGLLVLALLVGASVVLMWMCRKHYRKVLTRRHQRLALDYRQCRCGTARSLLATNPHLQMQHDMAAHQLPDNLSRTAGTNSFGGSNV